MTRDPELVTAADRTRARLLFGAAAATLILGISVAVARFPGGFDWVYTVISRLGSRTHNPQGAPWLTGSLLVALCLLWPVAGLLGKGEAPPHRSIAALRIGLIGGALVALEGLLAIDLSGLGRKAHEALALAAFIGLYGGVLGLYVHRIRRSTAFLWPALLVVVPLLAVGLSQLALYFDQRDLGWVNVAWRDMGIPFWYSFAFWQWMAVAVLGIGIGVLVATRSEGPPSAAMPMSVR